MTAALAPIITTLVVIAIIFIAIFVLVMFIKHKINSATRKYLGMNFQQTADLIGRGLREETTTPKPISNVAAVYKPKLERDFPDMTYERFLETANAALYSILTGIERESTANIENATDTLKNQVYDLICDNQSRRVVEHFDDIKIHRSGVSNYKSSSETATADFEISFQCIHYFAGKDKIPENPSQLAARVTLSYGQEFREDSKSLTYSHNCPNCGAPIYSVGGRMMKCQYCGTGITEEVYKSWLVSAFKFI